MDVPSSEKRSAKARTPRHWKRPPASRTSVAASNIAPLTYEHTAGAASAPLPRPYRRHEPEKTVLYGILREHLETFLEQARGTEGEGYPRFVEHEFRRFLGCGLLVHGFARLRCDQCGYERLLAFSCKGKLCPSCLARRTADTAAWLVDRLLPEADYRQWVLTFPWTMRFRLAADRQLLGTMLRVFLQTLFAWQRRRGRAAGIAQGRAGSITFLQRFGSALNLNVHAHCIVPDGLFVSAWQGPRAPLRFVPLPAPTTAEVEALTVRIAGRLTERLAAASEQRGDYLDPDLAALVEALFWSGHAPPGTRDIPLLPGMEGTGREESGLRGKPLCATVAGFSLHAAQVVGAHDREALERLCRYGLRAPFAQERLSRRSDGKVIYRLRRPWPHAQGATHLILEPLEFLRRLAALVSFPYTHQVRYHGVFANRSRFRRLLPPPPSPPEKDPLAMALPQAPGAGQPASAGAEGTAPSSSSRSRRHTPWAQLLRRVLQVEALACPRCSSPGRTVPMVVLAFLSDPEVVGKILKHLGLPTTAPVLARARPAGRVMGFVLPEAGRSSGQDREQAEEPTSRPSIRPPP